MRTGRASSEFPALIQLGTTKGETKTGCGSMMGARDCTIVFGVEIFETVTASSGVGGVFDEVEEVLLSCEAEQWAANLKLWLVMEWAH